MDNHKQTFTEILELSEILKELALKGIKAQSLINKEYLMRKIADCVEEIEELYSSNWH